MLSCAATSDGGLLLNLESGISLLSTCASDGKDKPISDWLLRLSEFSQMVDGYKLEQLMLRKGTKPLVTPLVSWRRVNLGNHPMRKFLVQDTRNGRQVSITSTYPLHSTTAVASAVYKLAYLSQQAEDL